MGEEKEPEGFEPTEEVGAQSCDATIEQCDVRMENEANNDLPRFSEEIQEAYAPEPIPMVTSQDGMPVPTNEGGELAIAPPFTIDHLVCVEDDREYVEMFFEELTAPPHSIISSKVKISLRSRFGENGEAQTRRRFDPSRVLDRWGLKLVQLQEGETLDSEAVGKWIAVRPRRERCKYYKRQVFWNHSQPDPNEFGHRDFYRNCTMRRSVGGAFLSLSNESVYACDYRDPQDQESVEKYIDQPDREHLRSGAHLVKVPLFKTE